jgi:O-methyltransferase involved in polyketide biosynthesis
MKNLSDVSDTALITLISRVNESKKQAPVLQDPMGELLLEKLLNHLPADQGKALKKRKYSALLSRHITLRARKYDYLCRDFLEEFPAGLIVSLGCGFDTRYWRLGGGELNYLELDLPPVVQLKKDVLGEEITYQILDTSVLDEAWMSKVSDIQVEEVLFIAEGLFMYLPREEVIRILKKMAASFHRSRLLMEVVAGKYTRGFRKKMVERKMRKGAGSSAGNFYQYGIDTPAEAEGYHPGFKLKEEWSYFEDPDIRPAFLRVFRHSGSLSRTQYTVVYDIA